MPQVATKKLGRRDLGYETDKFEMAALTRRFASEALHVIDLPYRLSSWALDEARQASRWLDDKAELLQPPAYRPDLDIAVESPEGRLAGSCICWVSESGTGPESRVEPLGCHKDFRHLALGRVALSEGLHRLQSLGVKDIYVETTAIETWRSGCTNLATSRSSRTCSSMPGNYPRNRHIPQGL